MSSLPSVLSGLGSPGCGDLQSVRWCEKQKLMWVGAFFSPRGLLLDRTQGSFAISGHKYLPLSRSGAGSSLSKKG